MKNILNTLILIIPILGFGQGFQNTFGGDSLDMGYSVQQTNDGGYVLTGSTNSYGNGDSDVYLIKTDGNGDSLWTRTFGGENQDYCNSVQQTTDGGYIITGRTESYGAGNKDVYLIKTDGNGDSLWTKTFGGTSFDNGISVQQTNDGGYIILGGTESYGAGNRDIYLIKTDGNGDSLWTKTFGGASQDFGNFVKQTNDGGYIVTGVTESYGAGNKDAYLIKTDASGDSLWTKTFGGSKFDLGNSVQQTNDGGYIVTGRTASFGAGSLDVYLIKTDGNGDSLWAKTFGGSSFDLGFSVQQTTDGGYIIIGGTDSYGNGDRDFYLIKTDVNGDLIWTKTFGGIFRDVGSSVQQTTDGGYIITGHTTSGNGDRDLLLIKADGNGNITSIFDVPTPNPNRKLKRIVDLLGREIKPQLNTLFIEIYDDGTITKKIIVE
jgi:hypothetical protein